MGHCQACRIEDAVELVTDDGEPPYLLCSPCARRLRTFSLRPREWFHLAAVHGPVGLLHDDFYDHYGLAYQPEEPVVDADRFPFPTLGECSRTTELALDVAYARWWLPSELIPILSAQPEETLALMIRTVQERPSLAIRQRALEVAAACLGRRAEAWVRDQWDHQPADVLFLLSQASSACLPRGEGLTRLARALSSWPREALRDAVLCLGWFPGTAALDLLETLVGPPLTEGWGRTAALCGLEWSRACRWLRGGRPLSLVALDALGAFVFYDTELQAIVQPHLSGVSDPVVIERELREYVARDPVPRVKRTVEALVRRLENLVEGKFTSIVKTPSMRETLLP